MSNLVNVERRTIQTFGGFSTGKDYKVLLFSGQKRNGRAGICQTPEKCCSWQRTWRSDELQCVHTSTSDNETQQFQRQWRDWLLALKHTKSINEFCKGWDKFIKDRLTSDSSKWLPMCNRYLRKSQTIASWKPAQCNGDESPCDMCPSLFPKHLFLGHVRSGTLSHIRRDWTHYDELKILSPMSYIDQFL